jgi:hypothetical protein
VTLTAHRPGVAVVTNDAKPSRSLSTIQNRARLVMTWSRSASVTMLTQCWVTPGPVRPMPARLRSGLAWPSAAIR